MKRFIVEGKKCKLEINSNKIKYFIMGATGKNKGKKLVINLIHRKDYKS